MHGADHNGQATCCSSNVRCRPIGGELQKVAPSISINDQVPRSYFGHKPHHARDRAQCATNLKCPPLGHPGSPLFPFPLADDKPRKSDHLPTNFSQSSDVAVRGIKSSTWLVGSFRVLACWALFGNAILWSERPLRQSLPPSSVADGPAARRTFTAEQVAIPFGVTKKVPDNNNSSATTATVRAGKRTAWWGIDVSPLRLPARAVMPVKAARTARRRGHPDAPGAMAAVLRPVCRPRGVSSISRPWRRSLSSSCCPTRLDTNLRPCKNS
jgi:hypothetical protein